MVEELGTLSENIKEMETSLVSLKDRQKILIPIVLKVLNITDEVKGTLVELKKSAVMVERAGTDRKSYKYKEVLDAILSKATKQFIDEVNELLEKYKTVTKILPTLSIKKIDKENLSEGAVKDKLMKAIERFKDWYSGIKDLLSNLKRSNTKVQNALAKLKK